MYVLNKMLQQHRIGLHKIMATVSMGICLISVETVGLDY